ncbi:solute carrier family 13 member 1-like [Erpetoichthys calabaricus]|uniref:Solute carrier family 13 member 1-like n=1 Tax=Erpetoichthys calabaricus TaxID=27687 RepID=A0A8C4RTN0_ERPCA|nr:solute carrier family 13 member 1-like [Erpetoichthys calabaricus]
MSFIKRVWKHKDALIVLLTPLLLLPLPVVVQTKEAACAYTLLITATYWISEAVPLGAAAIVPAFLFPIFGIMKSSQVAAEYFKDIHLLLFGVVCLAAAIEKWNLHKRIALRMVLAVGPNPGSLMLGFMGCTAFLSMWLSNTSTAAMVMPIAEAVLCQLRNSRPEIKTTMKCTSKEDGVEFENDNSNDQKKRLETSCESNGIMEFCTVSTGDFDEEKQPFRGFTSTNKTTGQPYKTKKDHMMCKALSLSIAYSSTIGGMTTITGTSTNLIFAEQFDTRYPDCKCINFGSWFIFSFPAAVIILILSWIWMYWLFLDLNLKELFPFKRKKVSKKEDVSRKSIKEEYDRLGGISYQEIITLVIFILMALSWFTRDPGFIPGWESLFGPKGFKTDATSGVLLGFLLFIIPSKKPKLFSWPFKGGESKTDDDSPSQPMISWREFESAMPWQIVILVGGGFALAKGCQDSGLSNLIGSKLEPLSNLPVWVTILLTCLIVTIVTEVASNPATITIFQPILCTLAEGINVNPLFIVIPATISTSCAFLLPVANPPNAIVFSYGHLKVLDMVKAGLGVNIISIICVLLAVFLWGVPLFNLNTFPKWAPLKNVTLSP